MVTRYCHQCSCFCVYSLCVVVLLMVDQSGGGRGCCVYNVDIETNFFFVSLLTMKKKNFFLWFQLPLKLKQTLYHKKILFMIFHRGVDLKLINSKFFLLCFACALLKSKNTFGDGIKADQGGWIMNIDINIFFYHHKLHSIK